MAIWLRWWNALDLNKLILFVFIFSSRSCKSFSRIISQSSCSWNSSPKPEVGTREISVFILNDTILCSAKMNLQTLIIWNAFSWMKMIEFRFEFHRCLFSGVQLTIRRQAITWTNTDPVHWRIYAALDPVDTRRNNNVIITSKRRRDVV